MERGAPERLLHERYMPLDTPFRLFRHQLEWTVPAHWHKFFEIAFATSGAAIELEGETLLQVEQEFARMWRETQRPQPGGEWVIAGALERVLVTMMRVRQSDHPGNRTRGSAALDPAIGEAATYIPTSSANR